MGVVDETVDDGISKCGVTDELVPVLHGQLARDERRAPAGSILDDFQEISPLAIGEWGRSPVIEDQELGLCQRLHELSVGAITTGDREIAEEPWQAEVAHTEPLPAGCVSQGTRQEGLARASGSGDEERGVRSDPLAGGPARAR